MPVGSAKYGPMVSNFTSATPGVITVDNTFQVSDGDQVRVEAIADDQSAATLNGKYTVDTVTANTITLFDDTSAKANYISGGYVTVLELNQPTLPNPPYDAYNNVPSFWNQSTQV